MMKYVLCFLSGKGNAQGFPSTHKTNTRTSACSLSLFTGRKAARGCAVLACLPVLD